MDTVTASNTPDKFAVNISKTDGETVIFHLAAYLEILTFESALHMIIEVSHLLLIIRICQRQHRILMSHLSELLIEVATHTLRWGIRVGKFWMSHL